MHNALKNPLYKAAKDYMTYSESQMCLIWTGYDDPTYAGSTLIDNFDTLKRVFKYAYNMGWPVIRVEPYVKGNN